MLDTCLSLGPLASDQPKYSLLHRGVEKDVLPFCRDHGIGVIVYSPIAQGLLTGKVTMDRTFPEDDFRQGDPWFQLPNRKRVLEALEAIRPIADGHGVTLAQLARVWLRAFVRGEDLGRIRRNQPVTVTTDAYPQREFSGRLSFIAGEAEFTPKSVQTFEERVSLMYHIKIDLDNPEGILKPGMPADARIEIKAPE